MGALGLDADEYAGQMSQAEQIKPKEPQKDPNSLYTNNKAFDDMVGGFKRGQLTIFTGRSGTGKSTITQETAKLVANNDQTNVVVYQSEIPHNKLNEIFATSPSYSKIFNMALVGSPDEFFKRLREILSIRKYEAVFIDDTDLVRFKENSNSAKVAESFHRIAREFNVAVIVAVQAVANSSGYPGEVLMPFGSHSLVCVADKMIQLDHAHHMISLSVVIHIR
jgi:replicative DNA helicase